MLYNFLKPRTFFYRVNMIFNLGTHHYEKNDNKNIKIPTNLTWNVRFHVTKTPHLFVRIAADIYTHLITNFFTYCICVFKHCDCLTVDFGLSNF